MANGKGARAAWLAAGPEVGRDTPHPGDLPSGKFIAGFSRSLDARLSARAKQAGVSMNALVSSFLAESPGCREGRSGAAQPIVAAGPETVARDCAAERSGGLLNLALVVLNAVMEEK